jgi:hypothetical protein
MTNENQQYTDTVPATPNGASLQAANTANGPNGQVNNDYIGSATPAPGNAGIGTTNASNNAKDRSRDLSTAKTAQSTPQNGNPNANRTIGHYVVGKYHLP